MSAGRERAAPWAYEAADRARRGGALADDEDVVAPLCAASAAHTFLEALLYRLLGLGDVAAP